MKIPKLTDLNSGVKSSTAISPDPFKSAAEKQEQVDSEVVRRTYSFERYYARHIDSVAASMTQELGKPVNASQALRAIIKRDMERGTQ